MAIPAVTVTVTDGALGVVPADSSAATAIIGTCSSGTADTTVYSYQSADSISTLKSELGYGPGPEAAASALSTDGSAVFVVRADTTGGTAAASSAVTLTGTGLNPGVTVSVGTGYDDYEVQVKIVAGGAVATATFQYSLDGGDTWSATIVSAATYAIPNSGLTIAFTAGTYVAGDIYSFTCTAATYTTTKMGTALDTLLASTNQFGLVHIVGRPSGASDTLKATAFAAMVAAVQTKLDTAATAYRYARAICDGPDVANDSTADGLLATAFVSTDAPRCVAAAGSCEFTSALVSGRKQKRPASWPMVQRARQVPIHESMAWVGRGSLGAGVALKNATGTVSHLDSRTRSTLDGARFATLRTHIGKAGAFVTQSNTMAQSTSDFRTLQNGRVMDRACVVAYGVLVDYLEADVRINATTGKILEADAVAIEKRVESALRDALTSPGHASAVAVTVNRDTNLLSTPTLKVQIRITPKGYVNAISANIGFNNPALQVVS
jgi:hypothetical protein